MRQKNRGKSYHYKYIYKTRKQSYKPKTMIRNETVKGWNKWERKQTNHGKADGVS